MEERISPARGVLPEQFVCPAISLFLTSLCNAGRDR